MSSKWLDLLIHTSRILIVVIVNKNRVKKSLNTISSFSKNKWCFYVRGGLKAEVEKQNPEPLPEAKIRDSVQGIKGIV